MKTFGKSKNADTASDPEIPVATLVPDDATFSTNPPATAPHHESRQTAMLVSDEPLILNGNSDPCFSRFPMMNMRCPECHQASRSKVRTYPVWQTWTAAGVGFFLCWPLCWIPLVVDSCKQSDHFCTSCGTKVGSVAPFEDCCVNERG